ncbi:hypothetical protein [Streptomyces sp. NPDC051909]|uniref:hypothetical protein n=1 Tax=Streptomyces sp. NPDC051909 TaxID=3154944 RepID=UPI00342DD5B3
MTTHIANGDTRFPASPLPDFWSRVRAFAVPAAMIETATARRLRGDWAGACAAAGFDVDLDLKRLVRARGRELAARVRADLRHLAPDLLRWHLPRIAPDGLVRPGLTIALARYEDSTDQPPLHLVVRTPPAWAGGGQRVGLALWDGVDPTWDDPAVHPAVHPHPRPSRRFRLDLHRHLWDARRAGELRERSGAELGPDLPPLPETERWAAEARILLAAEGRAAGAVAVRAGERRLVVEVGDPGCASDAGAGTRLPLLPDAATWPPPDLELLRTGAVEPGRLHPLVAAALAPGTAPAVRAPDDPRAPRIVECRGARHRIALVDGVLAPLDHDPAQLRREELLFALSGPPLPCLRAIDEAHRRPDCLDGVRDRIVHGDVAGALAVVEGLLGPAAVLRHGPLRGALHGAKAQRLAYGLYRAGLTEPPPPRLLHEHRKSVEPPSRHRPRHAFKA